MKWESSSNYSRDDMIRMQQDAVERVREMQRRSDAALKNAQRNPAFFTSSAPNPGVPIQQVHNQQNSSSHKRIPSVEKQAESLSSSETVQHSQSSQAQSQPQMQSQPQAQAQHQPQQPTPNESQAGETPPPPTQPENNMGQQRNYTMQQEQPSSPLQNFLGQTPLAGIGKGVESLLGTLTGPSNPQKKDTIAQLLEVLHLDGERILILMIILLLYNDGADYTLLFALLYLFI